MPLTKTPTEFAYEQGIPNAETLELARIKLGESYEGIINLIKNYMDMPIEQVKLVSVWIIGTYYHEAFSTYPFLFINAMRGSGKTRLLRMIAYLSKGSKGRVQTGITESVLFRMATGATLVLDELENIGSKEKGALREYMNACYKKGGIVQRIKKAKFQGQDEWVTETFEPYKPIAMANIFGMDEVLGDRCISFVLEKSSNPAKTKKAEDFDQNPWFKVLNEHLTGVSAVSAVSLREKNYTTAWNHFVSLKYGEETLSPPNMGTSIGNKGVNMPHNDPQQHIYINNINNTNNTNNTTFTRRLKANSESSLNVEGTPNSTRNKGSELTELSSSVNTKNPLSSIGNEGVDMLESTNLEEMFAKIDGLDIDGRNLELLLPLLLIAKTISNDTFEEILKIGKDIMEHKKEDEFTESRDVCLYEFISKQISGLNFVSLKLLTSQFKTFLGSDDDWINEKWMGRALKRLNLLLDRKREASGRIVRLNVAKAAEKLKIFKTGEEIE